MEFKDRLKIAIENKGVTPYAIGRDTKVSKVSVMNYLNGTKPNIGNISILADYLGVSVEWLISGENIQDNKKQEENTDNDNCTPHYEEMAGKAIPHIDVVTASCGLPNGFNSAIMKTDCERFIIPDMPGCDFTIRAGGRSMINRDVPERSINDRDIVGCRIVKSRSHIRWGEVYALATYDGIMIKKIEQSERDGYITCVPFNNDEGFKPYDIPVEEVYDWALVVGVVSVKTWI